MRSTAALLVAIAIAVGSAPSAGSDFVVGVALSAQGPKSALSATIEAAARQEADDLNAAGGIAGRPVRLVSKDDDCSRDGAERIAAQFIASEADLVIGHPCSNAAMAAAAIYAKARRTFIAIGPTHPDLTAKRAGPTIFRVGGRDDRQAVDTANAFAVVIGTRRLAIVHDRTAYATKLATGVATAFRTKGVPVAADIAITAGEKSYSDAIKHLRENKIDVIYFAGFPAEAQIVLDEIDSAKLDVIAIGCDALANVVHPRLSIMRKRQLMQRDIVGVIASAALARPGQPTNDQSTRWDAHGDDREAWFTPLQPAQALSERR